mmetsp:Transcript_134047/g.428264  ORF Transcript_134047/g.428264 Transcript_134047/m.428264 type:complete len:250 (+) Transcript_134047:3462-4211(+)
MRTLWCVIGDIGLCFPGRFAVCTELEQVWFRNVCFRLLPHRRLLVSVGRCSARLDVVTPRSGTLRIIDVTFRLVAVRVCVLIVGARFSHARCIIVSQELCARRLIGGRGGLWAFWSFSVSPVCCSLGLRIVRFRWLPIRDCRPASSVRVWIYNSWLVAVSAELFAFRLPRVRIGLHKSWLDIVAQIYCPLRVSTGCFGISTSRRFIICGRSSIARIISFFAIVCSLGQLALSVRLCDAGVVVVSAGGSA